MLQYGDSAVPAIAFKLHLPLLSWTGAGVSSARKWLAGQARSPVGAALAGSVASPARCVDAMLSQPSQRHGVLCVLLGLTMMIPASRSRGKPPHQS